MASLTHSSVLECNQYFLVLLTLVYIGIGLPEKKMGISVIFLYTPNLTGLFILKIICTMNIISRKPE